MEEKVLFSVVIYDRPTDMSPHMREAGFRFIARLWDGNEPTYDCYVAQTLDDARWWARVRLLKEGRDPICMSESENPDPCVVEAWL